MAVVYVNMGLTIGANNGTSWANAYRTLPGALQTGITAAGAGGTVFVKRDATTPADDTIASSVTLTGAGTVDNPTLIIGCLPATSATPPTDADLVARGTDTLPVLQATGAGSDINFTSGDNKFYGIRFDSADRISPAEICEWEDCEFTWNSFFFPSPYDNIVFRNCGFIPKATGCTYLMPGKTFFIGGVLDCSTAVPTEWWDPNNNAGGGAWHTGFDMSSFTGALTNFLAGGRVSFTNCKMNASFTYGTAGGATDQESFVEVIASSDGSSKAAGDTYQQYERFTGQGIVLLETTIVRSGGATDGATGAFSYKMTPTVNRTLESSHAALKSPWMRIWVVADGSAKTISVYTYNTVGDMSEDEMWMEVLQTDPGDTTQHDLGYSARDIIPGAATAHASDASGWPSSTDHAQILTGPSWTPGYTGWCYCRVHYAKRFASSPTPLYVDPQPVVA